MPKRKATGDPAEAAERHACTTPLRLVDSSRVSATKHTACQPHTQRCKRCKHETACILPTHCTPDHKSVSECDCVSVSSLFLAACVIFNTPDRLRPQRSVRPHTSQARLHTMLHCASRCPESLLHLMQMHSRCTDPHLH